MSTAIQRRRRPGLATRIDKFPLLLFLALLVWLRVQSPYFLSWQNIILLLVQSAPLPILCFRLVCVIAVGGDDVVSGGSDLSLSVTSPHRRARREGSMPAETKTTPPTAQNASYSHSRAHHTKAESL